MANEFDDFLNKLGASPMPPLRESTPPVDALARLSDLEARLGLPAQESPADEAQGQGEGGQDD